MQAYASSGAFNLPTRDMTCNANRLRALALYKELHRLGRDYPDPRSLFVKILYPFITSKRTITVTTSTGNCE